MRSPSPPGRREIAHARRRLRACAAALARLSDAYGVLRSDSTERARCDTPVSAARLAGIVAWRRAYDDLHARGVRPMSPDGRVVELTENGARLTLERAAARGGAWVVRDDVARRGNGPLAVRYPWVRL